MSVCVCVYTCVCVCVHVCVCVCVCGGGGECIGACVDLFFIGDIEKLPCRYRE